MCHCAHQNSCGQVCPLEADMVVGMNAGLEAYPSYIPTIQRIIEARRPFMCTDYNYESAAHAAGESAGGFSMFMVPCRSGGEVVRS